MGGNAVASPELGLQEVLLNKLLYVPTIFLVHEQLLFHFQQLPVQLCIYPLQTHTLRVELILQTDKFIFQLFDYILFIFGLLAKQLDVGALSFNDVLEHGDFVVFFM